LWPTSAPGPLWPFSSSPTLFAKRKKYTISFFSPLTPAGCYFLRSGRTSMEFFSPHPFFFEVFFFPLLVPEEQGQESPFFLWSRERERTLFPFVSMPVRPLFFSPTSDSLFLGRVHLLSFLSSFFFPFPRPRYDSVEGVRGLLLLPLCTRLSSGVIPCSYFFLGTSFFFFSLVSPRWYLASRRLFFPSRHRVKAESAKRFSSLVGLIDRRIDLLPVFLSFFFFSGRSSPFSYEEKQAAHILFLKVASSSWRPSDKRPFPPFFSFRVRFPPKIPFFFTHFFFLF